MTKQHMIGCTQRVPAVRTGCSASGILCLEAVICNRAVVTKGRLSTSKRDRTPHTYQQSCVCRCPIQTASWPPSKQAQQGPPLLLQQMLLVRQAHSKGKTAGRTGMQQTI